MFNLRSFMGDIYNAPVHRFPRLAWPILARHGTQRTQRTQRQRWWRSEPGHMGLHVAINGLVEGKIYRKTHGPPHISWEYQWIFLKKFPPTIPVKLCSGNKNDVKEIIRGVKQQQDAKMRYFLSFWGTQSIYSSQKWSRIALLPVVATNLHMFRHFVLHIFWQFIWHSLWPLICHSIWDVLWHSISCFIWHSIFHGIWHFICYVICHPTWHLIKHSIWHWKNL